MKGALVIVSAFSAIITQTAARPPGYVMLLKPQIVPEAVLEEFWQRERDHDQEWSEILNRNGLPPVPQPEFVELFADAFANRAIPSLRPPGRSGAALVFQAMAEALGPSYSDFEAPSLPMESLIDYP